MYIGNQPISTAFVTDTFSGTGSTTVFTMSVAPATTTSVLVAVTGVLQDPSTYSVSGTTLTFSAAPPTGTGNISVRYLGIPASGVTTTAYRTVTEFTATSGQTTFTVPSYTAGFINVYRNGVLLGSSDYTATSGTTVVLASGAVAGDLVTTESFYVSSVLNAIPATTGAVNTGYISNGAVTQVKLGTNVAGNGPAFSAYNSVSQTGIAASTFTKLNFDTEEYDTNNNFASSRFTPTVAGYYQCTAACESATTASSVGGNYISFYKNGSRSYENATQCPAATTFSFGTASALFYMNGTTDYLEVYVYSNAANPYVTNNASARTYFQAVLVRAA